MTTCLVFLVLRIGYCWMLDHISVGGVVIVSDEPYQSAVCDFDDNVAGWINI